MKAKTFLAILTLIGAGAAVPLTAPRPAVQHSIHAGLPPREMIENQDRSYDPTPITGEQVLTIQTSMPPPMKTLVTREAGMVKEVMVHEQTTMPTETRTATEKEQKPMFSIQTDPPYPQMPAWNIRGWPLIPTMEGKAMPTGILPGTVMQNAAKKSDAMRMQKAGERKERLREKWWPDVGEWAQVEEIEDLRAKGLIEEGPVDDGEVPEARMKSLLEIADEEIVDDAETLRAWLRAKGLIEEEVTDDGEVGEKLDREAGEEIGWVSDEDLDDEADEDYDEDSYEDYDEDLDEDLDEAEADDEVVAEVEQ